MLKRFVIALFLLMPAVGLAQLPDFTELVEKQGSSVVNISTTQTARNPLAPQIPQLQEDDPFYEFFRRFMPDQGPREFRAQSLGSGFIISQDGKIYRKIVGLVPKAQYERDIKKLLGLS